MVNLWLMMINNGESIPGWWLRKTPSEKYEFVKRDDYSQYMEK